MQTENKVRTKQADELDQLNVKMEQGKTGKSDATGVRYCQLWEDT